MVVLSVAAGYAWHWGATNDVRWEYLFNPVQVAFSDLSLEESAVLESPCGTFAVELGSVLLQFRGISVRGRYRQDLHTDYHLRDLDLFLSTEHPPDMPWWLSQSGFSGAEVVFEDGERLLQWHFPYRESIIDPDSEMHLGLQRYSFEKSLDVREERTVEQLDSLPLDIPIGDDGYLRIEELDPEAGNLVAAHIPSGRWEYLRGGIVFHFSMGAIIDDEYQRYGPHGGSATSGPGDIWIENIRLTPVNMDAIEHLVFVVDRAQFSWHYVGSHYFGDEEDDVSIRFRIPIRRF